jgi:hypothetical protein
MTIGRRGRLLRRAVATLLVALALVLCFAFEILRTSAAVPSWGVIGGLALGGAVGLLEARSQIRRARDDHYVECPRHRLVRGAILMGLVLIGAVALSYVDLDHATLMGYIGVPISTAFATMMLVATSALWRHERRRG